MERIRVVVQIYIIDTFYDYQLCFEDNLDLPVEQMIGLWEQGYISKYPELERKCKEEYTQMGYDWRTIAEERVFNITRQDFDKMIEAHGNILQTIGTLESSLEANVPLDSRVTVVLYCGLGNGAGWVDTYDNERAVLLGIEKMAELNWHTREKIAPLLAHELCHVIHFELRGEDKLPHNVQENHYTKGIWNLYEEGFAQFFQYQLLCREVDPRGQEWFETCRAYEGQLKKLYLAALSEEKKGTKDFFGDWFQVLGISDAGYYLGAEFISTLHKHYEVEEIAKLAFQDIERLALDFLTKWKLN